MKVIRALPISPRPLGGRATSTGRSAQPRMPHASRLQTDITAAPAASVRAAPVRIRCRVRIPSAGGVPLTESRAALPGSTALGRTGARMENITMTTRMLIDARHPEETRVAVLKGNRIEEFDFEFAEHKQIKGNIYLAKVTRVEPSLQAAFVDFGGNRHGFLAFSEIHPDYYQIPKEDREALLAEEADARRGRGRACAPRRTTTSDCHGDEITTPTTRPAKRSSTRSPSDGVEEIDTSEKDDVATIEGGHLEDGDDDGDDDDDDERATPTTTTAKMANAARGRGRGRRQGRGGRPGSRAKEVDEAARQAHGAAPPLQDPGRHPAPPGAAGPGRQGRARQQGRGADHLPQPRRPLLRADAQFEPRRRHQPQDQLGGGPQAAEVDRRRTEPAASRWAASSAPPGLSAPSPRSSATSIISPACGTRSARRTLKSSAPALIHSDSDLIKRAIRDIYNKRNRGSRRRGRGRLPRRQASS